MIVETQEQFKQFKEKYEHLDSIIVPIFSDVNLHPLKNKLSLIYIKLIGGTDYILPFNHNETVLDEPICSLDKLHSDTKKYTYDKKKLNHIIKLENVVDVNLIHYLDNGIPLDISELGTPIYNFYLSRLYNIKNLNESIPILKHLEYCRKLAQLLRTEKSAPFQPYNDEAIDILTRLEHSGINFNNAIEYTEYNMFTSTGRPSSRFGGINFAALNKEDGSRKAITSRFDNGLLVEYDFDAFHPRLIADIIGYEFPKTSVHEYLGRQYKVGYNKSKAMTFRYLYGGIPYNIKKSIPFFGKVDEYIQELWREYKRNDFIKSYIYSKKIYKKNMDDMNANRLFNWGIQLLETETNWKMLSKLLPFLDGKESKLILYGYDSFLIDIKKSDGLHIIKEMKAIIEQNGKYPTKIKFGKNYHEMKK